MVAKWILNNALYTLPHFSFSGDLHNLLFPLAALSWSHAQLHSVEAQAVWESSI